MTPRWPCDIDHYLWTTFLKPRCWELPGHYLCIPEPGRPGCVISIQKSVNATSGEKRLVRKQSVLLYISHRQGLKLHPCHNFWAIRVRAFIFHMYIPCDEVFFIISNIPLVTLWNLLPPEGICVSQTCLVQYIFMSKFLYWGVLYRCNYHFSTVWKRK